MIRVNVWKLASLLCASLAGMGTRLDGWPGHVERIALFAAAVVTFDLAVRAAHKPAPTGDGGTP